ncbi:MAG: 3-dehydroquinate synthase [Spirochaetales bacterium]|nr:3-dehydroquinate synthase [Spirochaetales bacterium]
MGTIRMNLGADSYDIVIGRGILGSCASHLNLDRKVMVVSDDGVPEEYQQKVLSQAAEGHLFVFPSGEESKNLETYGHLLSFMLDMGFSRGDCVVAVGGGVAGDLAGFAASCYMRGISFYNIPTTVLSQVDSSIGGKTAVNLGGVKNVVGTFNQPDKVLIDPDVLLTLPARQVSNGLAEALKMALTSDASLFRLFLEGDPLGEIDTVIEKSLEIKKGVVEKDQFESGLRRVLNFGHTIGHGIEAACGGELLHGECVALGMIPMCAPSVRKDLLKCLEKLGLPVRCRFDRDRVLEAIGHDKKKAGRTIKTVHVTAPGTFGMKDMTVEELAALLDLIEED